MGRLTEKEHEWFDGMSDADIAGSILMAAIKAYNDVANHGKEAGGVDGVFDRIMSFSKSVCHVNKENPEEAKRMHESHKRSLATDFAALDLAESMAVPSLVLKALDRFLGGLAKEDKNEG